MLQRNIYINNWKSCLHHLRQQQYAVAGNREIDSQNTVI